MSDQMNKADDQVSGAEGETMNSKEMPKKLEQEGGDLGFGQKEMVDELSNVEKDPMLGHEKKEEKKIEESRNKIKKAIPKSSDSNKAEIGRHAKEVAGLQDADQQIERLVALAQEKDPFLAIKVAQHLDNNFVLDQLHDGLLEENIRKVFVEKGFLKES